MHTKNNQPDKMDPGSMDIGTDNRAKLKRLFPAIFTETRNPKGELVESIDFEKLKAELGTFSDIFEGRRERYGMDWPGKKDCMKLIQQPSIGALKPCREESVDFDATENLFIEGDNLEALKLLQKSYYGKVKMIYIDPPYNTGKEFIYPDNYTESLDTYLAYAGLADDEGRKFSTNTPNEGRFHTKWLNMMHPRLYLARNLLRDGGVIFISIDDNEVSNLRKLCDEVFGEENFVANVVWEKKYAPQNDAKWFSDNHDHILVYSKIKEIWHPYLIDRSDEQNNRYTNRDGDQRGAWKSSDFSVKTYSTTNDYPITTPSGRVVTPPKSRCWITSKQKYEELLADNRIWFGEDGNNVPSVKKFLTEVKAGIVPLTIWKYSEVGHNQDAAKEIRDLFNENAYFDTPKPVGLITKMLQLSTSPNLRSSAQSADESDIILDFFSGSATTAHAVLDLNKQDNGNRKFIMVQLPEPCDENSEAFKAGYKTIADIGKERIRRVIKKLSADDADKTQIKKQNAKQTMLFDDSDNLRQSAQSADRNAADSLDLGFRVFKLDKSNFKLWDGSNPDATDTELARQLELHIDHINPKSSPEDVLFELLLKAGYTPTEKIGKRMMAGKTVYSVGENALLICLENDISRELIDAVAEAEPGEFICLDHGFRGNDQLKANAVQTFSARNQGRGKAQQIVFRTV